MEANAITQPLVGYAAMHESFALLFLLVFVLLSDTLGAEPREPEFAPADWGTDHIGKPIPNYVTGDECLFCHRKIGPNWSSNAHQLTVRPSSPDSPAIAALRSTAGGNGAADEVQFLMNSGRITRFLKRSKEYGKLELLNVACLPELVANQVKAKKPTSNLIRIESNGEVSSEKTPRWEKDVFSERCAGCHATAVEPETKAFSAISLDCYTCHGNVSLQHTQDVKRVLLSKTNREPRQVVSICGQCHLRGGRSRSSGLPYPNSFVAGDNLFRDFKVDLAEAKINDLPPIERHIFRNTRNVTIMGSKTTCLSCHNIHDQNSDKHQALRDDTSCLDCHTRQDGNLELSGLFIETQRGKSHSRVCDY